MFVARDNENFDPETSKAYKFVKKIFPLSMTDGNGKFWIRENGKRVYTTLFVVVMMLASIDLVFALDSIPAVMGISRDSLVIYTSNIFAVLGLRSLFFLLKGAVNKFEYLQQGIAIVLVFIGLKMLAAKWIDEWLQPNQQVFISLGVIVACVGGSILFSIMKSRQRAVTET
jgi:tellurite resistance protein TerC